MKLYIMKFNAAFRGKRYLVTWPSGSFECSPGGKKASKPTFSSHPGQFICLKKLCRIFFPVPFSVWSTVKCPGKPLPVSVAVRGRASLALAMLAGDRRTRGAVKSFWWVPLVPSLLLPCVQHLQALLHLWGWVTNTFPVITGTCTRLFPLISIQVSS